MQRPSVDLPQPDSPTRPSVSPRVSSRSTPSTARSTAAARAAQPRGRSRRAAGSASSRPRTSSSGSAIGDHRLPPHVRGARGRGGCTRSRGRRRAARSGNAPSTQSRCANGQRGWKRQPRRRRREVRRRARGSTRALADVVDVGHRAQQAERVRVPRLAEDRRRRRPSRRPGPRTSRRRAGRSARPRRGRARRRRGSTPSSLAQRREQLEDLVLDRDVERRRRLVAEDELRLARERDRDHHALAHPARQLVRVRVGAPLGIGDADQAHQLERALARRAPAVARAARAGPRRSARRRASPGSARSSAPGRSSTIARPRSSRSGSRLRRREVDALELDRCRRRSAPRAAAGRRARAAPSSCPSRTRRRGRAPRPRATSNDAPSTARSVPRGERELDAQVADVGAAASLIRAAAGRRGRRRAARARAPVITTAMPGDRRRAPSASSGTSARRRSSCPSPASAAARRGRGSRA